MITYMSLAILGVVLLIVLLSKSGRKMVGDVCAAVLESTKKKSVRKEEILSLFATRQELTNKDIQEALGIPSRSAVRYMDELESEGFIIQIGEKGRGVVYKLK